MLTARLKKSRHRSRVVQNNNSFIYGLIDPRSGQYPCNGLRYIGQTTCGMSCPKRHARPSTLVRETNKHKKSWILDLRRQGLTPVIIILEYVQPVDLDTRERSLIAAARRQGALLTNISPGGQDHGRRGYTWSAEGLKNQSRAQKLRFRDVAERKASSERFHAMWADPSYRTKIIARRKGCLTPLIRIQIARSLGGKPFTDQHGVVYQTIAEAVRILGIRRTGIQSVLHGRYRSTGGYVFRYQTKEDEK